MRSWRSKHWQELNKSPPPPKKKKKSSETKMIKHCFQQADMKYPQQLLLAIILECLFIYLFLLTFFGGSVHTHDCFSVRLHICGWGLYIVHCWSILPSPPACFYSRQMTIYLIWPIIVITLRTWKSKLVWMHIHWPVHIFLRKEHRYFE